MRTINFDMDGTIAAFYDVVDWLDALKSEDTRPYTEAKGQCNLSALARHIHRAQSIGYEVNIISWAARNSSEDFYNRTVAAKMDWLKQHLPSVCFDNIYIIPYGEPKTRYASGILFDDCLEVRKDWDKYNGNLAFDAINLLQILKSLV